MYLNVKIIINIKKECICSVIKNIFFYIKSAKNPQMGAKGIFLVNMFSILVKYFIAYAGPCGQKFKQNLYNARHADYMNRKICVILPLFDRTAII